MDDSDPYTLPIADIDSRPIGQSLSRPPARASLAPAESPAMADEPLELCAEMLADPPAKGIDFELGMTRFPPITLFLILAMTLIFGWELAVGALANEDAILKAGALSRAAVMRGEIWRIGSAMMLHGSSDHLLGNVIGLFMLGLAVEHAFGPAVATMIYGAAGAVAAIFCLIFEGGPTVGASGAIFGWWGAAVVFFYKHRSRLITRDGRVGFVLLIWAAWTIVIGLRSPHVSNFSHIGGFLCGAALASLIPTRLVALREPASGGQSPFIDD